MFCEYGPWFICSSITENVFTTHLHLIITSEQFRKFYPISHWICWQRKAACPAVLQQHWGISESRRSISVHDSLRLFSAQMQNAWLTIIGSGKIDEEQARENVCTSVCALRLGRVGVAVSAGQEMCQSPRYSLFTDKRGASGRGMIWPSLSH